MATRIKTLRSGEDIVLPRTSSKAIMMDDGTTLEYALNNRDTEDVQVTEELATALDVPLGTKLTKVIIDMLARGTEVLNASVE